MNNNIINKIIESSHCKTGRDNSTDELLEWVKERNRNVSVNIRKIPRENDTMWQYYPNEGIVANKDRTFFTISGYKQNDIEQPIILQNEIGYLGILCQERNGIMQFLMQAKIEPGNINKIQVSPTIQATKSNFMQKHGGNKPPYLEYFLNAHSSNVVVDQIQSEQASRFLGKRNRNIVVNIAGGEEIPILPSHKWMTLGQLKELMKYENLVNMDARTVISCLPLHLADAEVTKQYFRNMPLYRSMLIGDQVNHIAEIYNYINNCRMFDDQEASLIPLENLKDWEWQNGEFISKNGYHFKVVFCDIEIEGREVKRWTQPLFEATGIATFGLLCTEVDGIMKFVVRSKSEIGNFDGPELGPSIQLEADEEPSGVIEEFFMKQYLSKNGIVHDIILSEEGGRFYHEQNQNIVLNISKESLPKLPEGYFLVDYRTLSELVQVNNVLNIQLRNLLSLLEV